MHGAPCTKYLSLMLIFIYMAWSGAHGACDDIILHFPSTMSLSILRLTCVRKFLIQRQRVLQDLFILEWAVCAFGLRDR